jgi:hypothetical protein
MEFIGMIQAAYKKGDNHTAIILAAELIAELLRRENGGTTVDIAVFDDNSMIYFNPPQRVLIQGLQTVNN